MRSFKSIAGVLSALMPVVYCGGLLYYFLDLSGSVQEAEEIGLGPTVLGLGAVGLLFSIPLILKILRLFRKPRPPGVGGGRPMGDDDDDGGFDADAVIARYLARRAVEEAAAPAPRPARQMGGPAKHPSSPRPGFGRKNS